MSGRELVAGGRWPGPWEYDEEEVRYEETPCRTWVPGERLSYYHDQEERCGWCDRPISVCLEDPCPHYDGPGPLDEEDDPG